jgi:hypothetical protein
MLGGTYMLACARCRDGDALKREADGELREGDRSSGPRETAAAGEPWRNALRLSRLSR